jgi:dihydroorotate dehydrogenase electron transfer subunit
MKQFRTDIISHTRIAENYYHMSFTWPLVDCIPKPGQFLTLRVADTTVPLLRRPFAFSCYDMSGNMASIIYQKRGRGTAIMSGMVSGESIDIIGPLGNYIKDPPPGKTPILIAGGIGFGPLFFYSACLRDRGHDHMFILGVRSKRGIPALPSFHAEKPVICTDDGSAGYKGTALEYLSSLPVETIKRAVFYCCGPYPMLSGCHKIAEHHSTECWVVMEQTMACGVGACMGCVIRVTRKTGFARVCTEGPVFLSREIIWT